MFPQQKGLPNREFDQMNLIGSSAEVPISLNTEYIKWVILFQIVVLVHHTYVFFSRISNQLLCFGWWITTKYACVPRSVFDLMRCYTFSVSYPSLTVMFSSDQLSYTNRWRMFSNEIIWYQVDVLEKALHGIVYSVHCSVYFSRKWLSINSLSCEIMLSPLNQKQKQKQNKTKQKEVKTEWNCTFPYSVFYLVT